MNTHQRIPRILPLLALATVLLVAGCQELDEGTPATLIIAPSEATIEVNETIPLVAASTSETDSFTWTSSDTSIATVSEEGVVTGISAGEATIEALGLPSEASAQARILVVLREDPTDTITIIRSEPAPEDEGPPAIVVTLDTGEQFLLDDLDFIAEYDERAPDSSRKVATIAEMIEKDLREKNQPAANYVSLGAMQTAIRSQRDRGTCVAFAVLGATEAAYNRAGHGELHLSADYFHHLLKTTWLRDWTRNEDDVRTREGWENQLAMHGGGGIYNALEMLTKYRVATVNEAPYQHSHKFGHEWLSYQSTNQSGDDPRVDWRDRAGGVLQSTINNFSMMQEPITIDIPSDYTLTPMPQAALDNAKYGITGYTRVPNNRLNDVTWYETQLAAGREVIFACNFIRTTENDIIYPRDLEEDESDAGHAMVMVGYDRQDPDDPYFLVKNSWGESGFIKMSYDWVTEGLDGHVYRAAVITGVQNPNVHPFYPQLYMGRWRLVADGFVGWLDIHRDSQYFSANNLGDETDYRLGAYFDASGNIYRVNGTIDNDGRIEFYLDFDTPDLDYETLTGWKFEGYLQREDSTFMAGTFQDASGTGEHYGFYGIKGPVFQSTTRPGRTGTDVLLGRWEIVNAYVDGDVEIYGIDDGAGTFSGGYRDSVGWFFLGGDIDPATYELSFIVPNSGGSQFTGLMHLNNTGLISGVLEGDNNSGMTLVRRGAATESIAIVRPNEGDTFDEAATIQLEADVKVDGLEETNPTVMWTLDGPYQPGDPTAYMIISTGRTGATKRGAGLHEIYATYIGEQVYHDKVSIVVTADNSPDVSITSPENDAFIVDYSTVPNVSVDVTGMATSHEGDPITGDNLEWEYRLEGSANWVSGGTGEAVTLVLANNACDPSRYEIRLRATDTEGNTSFAIIQVRVQGYIC